MMMVTDETQQAELNSFPLPVKYLSSVSFRIAILSLAQLQCMTRDKLTEHLTS